MSTLQELLKTKVLEVKDSRISWPSEVHKNAFTLVYSHSDLQLNRSPQLIDVSTLYEAWAFDGYRSWHIWQHEEEWVCTVFEGEMMDKADKIEVEQYLGVHFQRKLNKEKLVIIQTLDFDDDGQAYVTYTCPIDIK